MKTHHILFFFFFFNSLMISASVQDSLGVEKKGNKYYVQHQMEAKETIYALSRRYNVAVADIKAANPGIDIKDISIGQVLLVPAPTYIERTTSSAGVKSGGVHKVEPKETLYSLSRQYNVSVDKLKKANPDLQEKGLQIGMELIIPGIATEAKTVAKKPNKPAKEKNETLQTAALKNETPVLAVSEPAPKKASAPVELPKSNGKIEKISENGIAELAAAKPDGPDFYAYHKTAPIGTIIQVQNLDNGQTAYVRVIGAMNNATSATTLVQLSSKAMSRLEIKDQKAKVTLSYFLP